MSYSLLLGFHIAGVVIGLGGAFFSDALFMASVRDGSISEAEMRRLTRVSRIVWTGLVVLFMSGIGLFLLAPAFYLASHSFLAKMTLVGILLANGILFHAVHIPWLKRRTGRPFSQAVDFEFRRLSLLVSGAISSVSWMGAFVLALTKGFGLSYTEIIGLYVIAVCVAVAGAYGLRMKLIPRVA